MKIATVCGPGQHSVAPAAAALRRREAAGVDPRVVGDEQARPAAAEDEAQPHAGAPLPAAGRDPRAGRRPRFPASAVGIASQRPCFERISDAAVEGVDDLRGAAEHQRRRGDRLAPIAG